MPFVKEEGVQRYLENQGVDAGPQLALIRGLDPFKMLYRILIITVRIIIL